VLSPGAPTSFGTRTAPLWHTQVLSDAFR
jgi:hypothetical protein